MPLELLFIPHRMEILSLTAIGIYLNRLFKFCVLHCLQGRKQNISKGSGVTSKFSFCIEMQINYIKQIGRRKTEACSSFLKDKKFSNTEYVSIIYFEQEIFFTPSRTIEIKFIESVEITYYISSSFMYQFFSYISVCVLCT